MTLALVPVLLVTAYLLGLGIGEVWGVTSADLTLVVVVGLALARGPVPGAAGGFGAGLLLDLAPGSTYPVGSGAFAGTVTGALLGMLAEIRAQRDLLSSRPTASGRALVAAGVTAAGLVTQLLARHGVGAVLGAVPDLYRPAVLLPLLGTVLLAGWTVPALTALLRARDAG